MNELKIDKITAEEIFDSRGNPTIEVSVYAGTHIGRFSVPSGASTGSHEALELRDGGEVLGGNGVSLSIQKIQEVISPALRGMNIINQKEIDQKMIELDGTKNKSNLGGNSIIGVSMACARTGALVQNQELFQYLRDTYKIDRTPKMPYLYMNLINGGKHAKDGLAFQEYHVVPQIPDVEEAFILGKKIFDEVGKILETKFPNEPLGTGDEGGYAPKLSDSMIPFDILNEAIEKVGGNIKARIAIDAAASSFYKEGKYQIDDKSYSPVELENIYSELINKYNLISIEDPFFEEDFTSFYSILNNNKETIIIGDDLTVTNVDRLKTAIENKSISGIIIKPNQIGTLTETVDTINMAHTNNIECIVSHRSGETDDDFIADLSYAFGCFGIKAGAPQKGERVAKYNRLMHIARIINKD